MIKIIISYLFIISISTQLSFAEFQVNTRTSSDQANAAITMDANGSFVVIWSSRFGTPGRSNDIFGRRFDPNCSPLGEEFQINSTTAGNQTESAAAMDVMGSFIVAWQGPGIDQEEIFARRYDPNGQPFGDEFLVNTYTQGQQCCPKVAVNRDGAFVVVWESEKPEAGKTVVSCKQFDVNGLPLGEEFKVNLLDDCRYPDVAMDPNGNFAVAWMEDGSSNNLIMVRLFNADGTARTKPLDASTIKFNTITRPSIAMDANGYFVVTWDGDPKYASLDDIHARLFDPNGSPVGEQFVVNTTLAGAQQYPQVSMNNNGEFVIVWESEIGTNGRDIFARRYDSSGKSIGSEFQINSLVKGDRRNPDVAIRETGEFVTVWQSDGQDGSGYGIFGEIKSIADTIYFTPNDRFD